MPSPALVDALRQKATDAVDAVWRQVRADAEERTRDRDRAAGAALAEIAHRTAAEILEVRDAARAQAENKARAIRAGAKVIVAERSRNLAAALLPTLRTSTYADVFAALVAELPPRAWTHLIVNPMDIALARDAVANVEISTDATMAGGLIAEGDGLRVANTLEVRLASAWPDLLAAVMNDAIAESVRP